MTGRDVARVLAAATLALALTPGIAAAQTSADFADWTQLTEAPRAAIGTLHGNAVSLEGSGVASTSTLDGSNTAFDDPAFTPPLPASDTVDFSAVSGNTYTLSFGAATTNPVLHLGSLASTVTFPPGTTVTRVSGDMNFAVNANEVLGGPSDGNGTVRLEGTFSTIDFSTSSMFVTDGVYLQVGAVAPPGQEPPPPPPPEPTPPPPPPPPASLPPENVSRPEIVAAGGGVSEDGVAYRCDPGEWRNLATPPGFTFAWRIQGKTRVEATTQTWTPTPSLYGYPVVCDATAPGPNGPVTATSAPSVFSSAGADRVPPPYGDVRIRGIDVFQVVQPNAGSHFYGYRPDGPFFGLCGAGTPTAWRGDTGECALSGRNPQSVLYDGVRLDSYKPTTAMVYVDVAGAWPSDPELSYDLVLSGFDTDAPNRKPLGSPVVVRVSNPPRSDTPWVEYFERDNVSTKVAGDRNNHAVAIQIPYAWRSRQRSIRLEADLRFAAATSPGKSGYGIVQCETSSCSANDRFTLRTVPFDDWTSLRIASLALERFPGQNLPFPGQVLKTAMSVFPNGAGHRVMPYQGTVDISGMPLTATFKATKDGKNYYTCSDGSTVGGADLNAALRNCRWNHVAAQMVAWGARFPARDPNRYYDVLFGVHDYQQQPGGNNEPGTARGNITAISKTEPSTAQEIPVFTADGTLRPLTAAAHELGHVFTAPHASHCKGAERAEEWPESTTDLDRKGRLQSTKFRAAPPGGGAANQVTVASPSIFAGPYEWYLNTDELFDFMSYCAGGDSASSDGTAWLSARNWNRVTRELGALEYRLEKGVQPIDYSRPIARAAAAPPTTGHAVGTATPAGGKIDRVVAPRKGNARTESVPGAPYRLRSLDAGGGVLLDAGVEVTGNAEDPEAGGIFAGPVDPRAVTVELVHDGMVLDSRARTRPPAVRLLSTRAGSEDLEVRWSATDPDGGNLTSEVDFSADDGRTWRPVRMGAGGGSATIPRAMLAGGRRARVRVTVSDGFAEASATSQPFAVQGLAPQVTITGPDAGALVRPGERVTLSGSAFDDRQNALGGRSLTWLAGKRRLGSGNRLQTRLPRGTRHVRLVASDRNGLTGEARVAVRVTVPRLHVVSLQVPNRVRRSARTMRVRLRTSAPATVAVGAQRFALGRSARTIEVRLPRRPASGILGVAYRITPRGALSTGTVRGRFAVARA